MSIDAIGLVREHGVVLECAKGPVPNLADAVAGNPIRGNCWNHPDDKQTVRATRLVRDSEQVLECRLAGGKLGAPVGWGRSYSVGQAIQERNTGCDSRRTFRLGRVSSCGHPTHDTRRWPAKPNGKPPCRPTHSRGRVRLNAQSRLFALSRSEGQVLWTICVGGRDMR
jgi:hypothetical protein